MEKFLCLFLLALCGASASSLDAANRITVGNLATADQFPYAVSLQQLSQLSTYTRGHRCGGVLVTAQHVLTAASCLFNTVNSAMVQINPAEYKIFAGAVHLTNDTDQERIRSIVNFTAHPQYVSTSPHINDIGIITLSAPFSSNITSALPLPSLTFEPADFTLCTVAGWGSQNLTATASVELRYANKYIYNQDLCRLLYGGLPTYPNILQNMICASSYDIASGGCTGDQGNALVCNGSLTGILTLTNNCMNTPYPEVYVRLSNYTEWITSITGGASTFQPGVAVLIMFAVVQLITASIS